MAASAAILITGHASVAAEFAVDQARLDKATALITSLAENAMQILRASDSSLEEREQIFRRLLRANFDLALIGRFVLGRHWRKASQEQRDDYQRLFGEFVVKTYSSLLGGYTDEEFRFGSARPIGKKGDVLVRTSIIRPDAPPVKTDWRVRTRDGQQRIIDVIIEGISMASTQREEFASVIKGQGMEGLLQALRARTQRLPAQPPSLKSGFFRPVEGFPELEAVV